MADSKTLVEIVEKSYCTAFSDILWEKKHGSREQVTESVFVCIPHLQGPREECKSPVCKCTRSCCCCCCNDRAGERASASAALSPQGQGFSARVLRDPRPEWDPKSRSSVSVRLSLCSLLGTRVPSNEISMFQVLTPPRCLRIQILKNVDGSGTRSQTRSQCIQKIIFFDRWVGSKFPPPNSI
jgi:hypothetical protein